MSGNYSEEDYEYDFDAGSEAVEVGYCTRDFRQSMNEYNVIHPYISLAVCAVGSLASVLNMVVLNQKHMVSPTNILLTGLAVADMLLMLDYMPNSIWNILIAEANLKGNPEWGPLYSYSWTSYRLFHQIFYKVFHAVSIWLTVTLAVWRYLVVCWPHRAKEWCGKKRARWATVSAYVSVPILFIPEYMLYSVMPMVVEGPVAISYNIFRNSNGVDPDTLQYTSLFKFDFWILGVFIKLIPCVALTILSLRLVWALVQAGKVRKYLMNNRSCSVDKSRPSQQGNSGGGETVQRNMDRTTRMLLAVLFCFLASEFPQGILALLVGMLDFFWDDCYQSMERLLQLIILINCAINFILYCSMSKEFRETFRDLFIPSCDCRLAVCIRTNASKIRSMFNNAMSTLSCGTGMNKATSDFYVDVDNTAEVKVQVQEDNC